MLGEAITDPARDERSTTEGDGAAAVPEVVGRLVDYLATIGERVIVEHCNVLAGGRSAQTIGLRVRDAQGKRHEVVLSQEAQTGPLAGLAGVTRQFDLLKALESTPVPAPRARWVSEDPTAIGLPFLVTDHVSGTVVHPWRSDGRDFLRTVRDDEAFLDSVVQALADIHAVSGDALPASTRRSQAVSTARRELERWSGIVAASSAFRDDPVLAYAAAWLAANRPAQSAWTLCHGDFRMGNLLLEDRSVAAVLDWELAEEGDPALDVALLSSPALRVDALGDAVWKPGDFLARYERLSGRRIEPAAFAYYRVLATFKIAGVWVNGSLAFDGGAADLHSLRSGYSVLELRHMLAEVLDLPVPESAEPAVASRFALAARTLRAELRDGILSTVVDDAAREDGAVMVAILRSMARSSEEDAHTAQFETDVNTFVREFGAAFPELDDADTLGPGPRLTRCVRHAFAVGDGLGSDRLGRRMRELVGRAAGLSLGMWP